MPAPPPVRPGSLAAWAAATRPMSLPLALAPVLVGMALAYARQGQLDPALAALALLAALLMQLVTNLQNDIGFTARGGEAQGNRRGLPRATAQGWLSLGAVRLAIVALSLLALALGLALWWLRGWPVLALGTASLLAALAYMGGPRPIAYTAYGELTVFVFFGLVAVLGTDWLLGGTFGGRWNGCLAASCVGCLAASCVGCLAAAALAVNNHRDRAHDMLLGRRTFAVRFGAHASARLLDALLGLPFALCVLLAALSASPWTLLPLLLLAHAWRLRQAFAASAPGLAYNAILFGVFRLTLWFAALLSVALVLARP